MTNWPTIATYNSKWGRDLFMAITRDKDNTKELTNNKINSGMDING